MEEEATRGAANLGAGALEGRLLALRRVLALLLAAQEQQGGREDLREILRDWSLQQDHQEDPGAVASETTAIQGAMALEIQLLGEAMDRAAGETVSPAPGD